MIAIPFLLRLFFSVEDFERLCQVRPLLEDDTYYYQNIARNVVHGKGFTEDGQTPTTGFQLAQQLLCVALELPADPKSKVPLRMLLALQVLLSALVVTTNHKLYTQILGDASAKIATFISAFWLLLFRHATNGLETVLVLLAISIVLRTLYDFLAHPQKHNITRLGIWCFLLPLARVDTFAFVLPLVVLLVYLGGRKRILFKTSVLGCAVVCIAFSIGIGIIVITNISINGHWIPDSGEAVKELSFEYMEKYMHVSVITFPLLRAGSVLVASLPYSQSAEALVASPRLILAFSSLALLANVWFVLRQRMSFSKEYWWFLFPWMGFGFVIVAAYVFYVPAYWYFGRYFFPFTFFSLLLIAPFLEAIGRYFNSRIGKRNTMLLVTVAALWFSAPFASRWTQFVFGPIPPHVEVKAMGEPSDFNVCFYPEISRWLELNTKPQSTIAMWQGGLVSYLSDRTIIHLDGLVNREVIQARRTRTLDDYLRKKNAVYWIDYSSFVPFMISCSRTPETSYHLIATTSCTAGDSISLYGLR